MGLLEGYFASKTKKDFLEQSQEKFHFSIDQAKLYYDEITNLLISSNQTSKSDIKNHKSPLIPNLGIEEIYGFKDITLKINYGSEKIKFLIHPQWAHVTSEQSDIENAIFHIFQEDNELFLFKEQLYIGHYPLKDYHILQGQISLQVINALYQKEESDWIATFHASTVCNDKEAIMLIGDSGNGKSTLSAILMAHGFDVLADDFTPLSAQNKMLYRFPSGISVKPGAFNMLRPSFADFDKFPVFKSTSKNVNVKYIPPIKSMGDGPSHLPCKKIVFVKYDAQANSQLNEIGIDGILQTLIPESWISPLASNSKLFLEWLKDLECYELIYAENDYAISSIKKLFNS